MKPLILFVIGFAVAGCTSQPPSRQASNGAKVKAELMLFTPEQQELQSTSVGTAQLPDQGAVLIGPDVIAYPIAGRRDPNHPDIAYAGTWAFRRTAPQWKLLPAPTKDIVFGPARNDARQDVKPAQHQEMETLILEQRTLNDQNRQAITRLMRVQLEQQKQLNEVHQLTIAKDKADKAAAVANGSAGEPSLDTSSNVQVPAPIAP